jgi:hypothetical protein
MKELVKIQGTLKANKCLRNDYGKFNYRSAETILQAVKPICQELGCQLILTDDIQMIGDRYYVKATATLTNADGEKESATAFARECPARCGMDEAQITGAASSYARKYALNGLFAIDDTKDPDDPELTKKRLEEEKAKAEQATATANLDTAKKEVEAAKTVEELNAIFYKYKDLQKNQEFINALTNKKNILQK